MTTPQDEHIERFRQIVSQRLGLQIDDSGTQRLAEVFCQRLHKTNAGRAADYLERIGGAEPDREELQVIAGELAIGETFFFRYPAQFEALARAVLPALVKERPAGELRLLSAGCASGEEAYSLAIVAREVLGDAGAGRVQVVAIDYSRPLLEKSAGGRYSTWSLRALSDERRERWFRKERREFVLDESLRGMVAFEERNLVEEDGQFWRPNRFDLVFFRNVSIYFANETTRGVISRITRSLTAGGYLFLGPTETLRGVSQDFHLRHTHEAFYYQRLRPGEHRPASHARPEHAAQKRSPDPAAVEKILGGSWVEAIGRASTRIAALGKKDGEDACRAAKPPGATHQRATAGGKPFERYDLASAWALLGQERFEDALKALDTLPAESSVDPDVLLMRAALLTNRGKIAEAESVCRVLLARDEMDAGAHYLAALCREHVGDRRGAVEHGQTAVYLDPGFAMACFHLGLLAKRSGDLETARRELGQALQLLEREHASRILLFGGGFSRQALIQLCRAELRACGGPR